MLFDGLEFWAVGLSIGFTSVRIRGPKSVIGSVLSLVVLTFWEFH